MRSSGKEGKRDKRLSVRKHSVAKECERDNGSDDEVLREERASPQLRSLLYAIGMCKGFLLVQNHVLNPKSQIMKWSEAPLSLDVHSTEMPKEQLNEYVFFFVIHGSDTVNSETSHVL
jgi:hypothetical protein